MGRVRLTGTSETNRLTAKGRQSTVDPFVSTIIKQGLLIGLGVGAMAFAVFFMIRMASLQHAMTLNMLPTSLP